MGNREQSGKREQFYHPRNLVLIGSHFLFLFSSCPWQSLNYFLSLDLPIVGIPYRWNLITLGLLCQASFTYVFKAYPCCSMYQYFNSTQNSYSALQDPAQLGIPTSSAITLPLAHCVPALLISLLFLKHSKHAPASGFLLLMLFPHIATWLAF